MTLSARDIFNKAQEYNVRTGMSLTRHRRLQLEVLAEDCGLSCEFSEAATDNDLIGLCLVAQKDGEAAIRMAAKISARLAAQSSVPDPLLGPDPAPAPAPAPRAPEPAPTPAPKGEPSLSEADMRRIVRDALQEATAYADKGDDALHATISDKMGDMASVWIERLEQAERRLPDLAREAVAEALKAMTPTRLNISLNSSPTVPLGLVHRDTAKIIKALAAGVNVYLHGPAGSGKTTVARKAAEAFGLQFYFAAKVESEYQLLGFTDAKGDAVRTPFRDAYEHGGLFLFDEMDASSPAAVVALNAALANGICPFPDAIVTRHANFYVVGAGNTKLTGANRQYAGRNKLDAASIDRFAFIEFGYDDELERALAGDAKWCAFVQKVRKACADRGIDHLVTPRATYDGCKLLAEGFSWEEASDMCVFKGLDTSTVDQILTQVGSAG